MKTIRAMIRGAKLAYSIEGEGPIDIVWGHGLTQSRALDDELPFLDWSRTDARVLRYDARGHGDSSSTPDLADYSWESLARDQLELATHARLDRYVAAGASMGAATALHAAVLAPERIRGLILMIPPTGWETRAAQTGVYEQGAKAIEAFGIEAIIKASAVAPPPDPFANDPTYRDRRAAALRTWEPDRLARVMRGATHAQLPDHDVLATITCPTLILAWTGDAGHPVSTATELDRLMANAELHVASAASDVEGWPTKINHFLQSIAQ